MNHRDETSLTAAKYTRRTFLKTGAAAVAGLSFAPAFSIGQSGGSANDRLRYAVIGAGYEWQTRLNRSFFDKDEQTGELIGKENSEVIALCDVSNQQLGAAGKDHPKARKFTDFRKMFDEMGGEIDAATMSVKGMPELDPWITPVYHNGWKFPV